MGHAPVHVGCSGWNYASWRGTFYPAKMQPRDWLEWYARTFATVEVNSTFYRLARRDAVARWVEQTPEDFIFTIKSSRYLTHMKRLTDMGRGVERLYEPLQPLVDAGRLGPVLWQLPPNMGRDLDRLSEALEQLPPGRHCFEFRHPTWFHEDVYGLLRYHGVAHAIGDDVRRQFVEHEITADWAFVRFHYGTRGRRGNYSQTELREWAARIASWAASGIEVFAYFNNDWETFAPPNAVDLRRFVAAELGDPEVAALPGAQRAALRAAGAEMAPEGGRRHP
jgi:uncharacterized protein YecE (DUF72 family)